MEQYSIREKATCESFKSALKKSETINEVNFGISDIALRQQDFIFIENSDMILFLKFKFIDIFSFYTTI